jgi:hypothetical protein
MVFIHVMAGGLILRAQFKVGGGSKEEGWRRKSQGIGNEPRMERPRSPCEMRESLRQVERAQGEVRKPKCQRMEG